MTHSANRLEKEEGEGPVFRFDNINSLTAGLEDTILIEEQSI